MKRPGAESALPFPKRFYKVADIVPRDGGFALTLDGRTARTPAKSFVVLPSEAAARAVADEWAAVVEEIDPRIMPLTRLVNSVIDGVSRTKADVLDEVIRYASSDLLVYRAADPMELVHAQQAAWDPVVAWSAEVLGAPLTLAEGIIFVAQPQSTLDQLAAAARSSLGEEPVLSFRLGALHVMTTLTGSALLGLAVTMGHLTAEQAWAAAHVDEDHQIARWGEDEEAAERRASRWIEMRTASLLLLVLADA